VSELTWQEKAAAWVESITVSLMEAHRGAFFPEPGVLILFGNDGYATDARSQGEVEYVRKRLPDFEAKELGFATDKDGGYSWAMLVQLPAAGEGAQIRLFGSETVRERFTNLIWDGWDAAGGNSDPEDKASFRRLQQSIARRVLDDFEAFGLPANWPV
jgi:hypothetical protein